MSTNKKIFNIASSLYSQSNYDIPSLDDAKDILDSLTHYKDYFTHLTPIGYLKLILCFYGVSQKMTLQEIEKKIFDKLFFAVLFESIEDYVQINCTNCDGDGYIRCSYCQGSSREDCPNCHNGDVECDNCNGTGEIDDETMCEVCNGSGNQDCYRCGGTAEVNCHNCDGHGTEECESCNGNGEVDSDLVYCWLYFIASYNPKLNHICELEENTETPITTSGDLENPKLKILTLATKIKEIPISSEFFDNIYCVEYLGDSPNLKFENSDSINFQMPESGDEGLLKFTVDI